MGIQIKITDAYENALSLSNSDWIMKHVSIVETISPADGLRSCLTAYPFNSNSTQL